MQKKKSSWNRSNLVLCALVFFVVGATLFCMVANSKEDAKNKKRVEEEKRAEEKRKEKQKIEAEKKAEEEKKKQFSVQPGVPVGTFEPDMDKKVVYLTFDDGPSDNTKKILDILDRYDIKATFFITGINKDSRPLIKEAYEAGHTIGLHTYSHNYKKVYASEDAYFKDLEKVGKVAEEQIGFVPCFIRFPGGSSNLVSAEYSKGIMSKLVKKVQEKGYQYYDWNVDSGDGAGEKRKEIVKNSTTDKFSHPMILLHDAAAKKDTVQALPEIIEYYKKHGYDFQAIDRESFVSQHGVQN